MLGTNIAAVSNSEAGAKANCAGAGVGTVGWLTTPFVPSR